MPDSAPNPIHTHISLASTAETTLPGQAELLQYGKVLVHPC